MNVNFILSGGAQGMYGTYDAKQEEWYKGNGMRNGGVVGQCIRVLRKAFGGRNVSPSLISHSVRRVRGRLGVHPWVQRELG